jgi:penicillin amidase
MSSVDMDPSDPKSLPSSDQGPADASPPGKPGTPEPGGAAASPVTGARRWRNVFRVFAILVILAAVAFVLVRRHMLGIARENLPQLDGSLAVYGLSAPVTVERDARGVPHIRAGSLDDLVFAQGYVTAQDRLWQMDLLRRHASGQLAAILGSSFVYHDRLQRFLQLDTAATRALDALPADQKHWLEVYARGVNASLGAQIGHLPVEFRIIGYKPVPWTPRDSLLVGLVMYQDLTTGFPVKLAREALAAHLTPDLMADLYPTGSWRDHWPGEPAPDVTAPQPDIPDIPLDESQSQLRQPQKGLDSETRGSRRETSATSLRALQQTLAVFHAPCDSCVAGSNGWAVAGSRTASGKPMLSNDIHLSLSAPELWYEADLEAPNPAPLAAFHAAGITLPGMPFVVAGHNDHVAWGFTILGADVQDLYIEHTRGTPTGAEFQTVGGDWKPVRYQAEVIHVRGGADVTLDVPLTRHGDCDTPIVSSIFSGGETRTVSLRWTVYDPTKVNFPLLAVDSASDWASMLDAAAGWGAPPVNLIYADDQGHIGYHAIGPVPVRGDMNNPAALSAVPIDTAAPDAASHEWVGYIPFDQLPQVLDPPGGILVTANGRVTPDGYRYPITLNWMAPYRTERIYKILESGPGQTPGPTHPLAPADMLAIQTDVFSELDRVIAQRLAYAIDHTSGALKNDKSLHQAADLLRNWNGQVDANSAAPAIVDAARAALWPMLLIPKLAPQAAAEVASGADLSKDKSLPADAARTANLWAAYVWGERDSVEEEIVTHTPARWLPPTYANWDDFLAAVVQRGLHDAHAPRDLSAWQYGKAFPLDLEHPIFGRSQLLQSVIGVPTGTGPEPDSGDLTTIKQVGPSFGPSDRFTTDLGGFDSTTLNLVLGQSGNPASPWYMDQFEDWLHARTYALPFTPAATRATITHTLTLTPQ